MSDASMPHRKTCGKPEYACVCDAADAMLEQVFAELVASGEFEVSKHDAAGKPVAWRLRLH